MKHSIFLILFLATFGFVQAQTLTQAKDWYVKGQYEKALPAFNDALKTKPADPSLNLWYGVCLLETGKTEASLPYLTIASNKKLPEADRYLAKYYFDTFAPDSALVFIDRYLANPKISADKKQSAQTLKTSFSQFVEQMQKVEDICFIDSVIVPKSALFSTIKLSVEAGTIQPIRQAFPNESANSGSVYFPERNDRAYYAGKTPKNGLDIVARHRVLDTWGEVESLSDVINTDANECNPYFLSDGVTLYFASNGHESMGGYDLFVTRLNRTTNTYLLPDHLNMPFNSTANDYFLIIDELKMRGYLATDRNQTKDNVIIYTFIPNPTKVLLQGKSFKELQDFAQIRSIKATQKGKNLDSLLHVSTAPILTVKENENTFIFTINDQISISKESEFKSDEAKQLYLTYRTQFQKSETAKKDLSEKRLKYLNASPAEQQKLSTDILNLESEIRKYDQERPSQEKRIRNLEIDKRSK